MREGWGETRLVVLVFESLVTLAGLSGLNLGGKGH